MTADLTSDYLGMTLQSPLVASASPMTGDMDQLCRLSDAGVGAVVLPSLFEEQIEHDAIQWHHLSELQAKSFAEGLSYFPELDDYNLGPDEYIRLIESAKRVVNAPVIASLNGQRLSGWTNYARRSERAGADAIELNIYRVVTEPTSSAADVENEYVELVSSVCRAVSVPVSVKLGPQFTALPHLVLRLEQAGAAGLVLFNRFLCPDIDLHKLTVTPHLSLSTPAESLQAVRWIAILRDRVRLSLAATSGVHSGEDVIKLLLVGADAVMLTSGLLQHGPEHLLTVYKEMKTWLEENDYESIDQLRGSMSLENYPHSAAFERANYMQALISFRTNSI